MIYFMIYFDIFCFRNSYNSKINSAQNLEVRSDRDSNGFSIYRKASLRTCFKMVSQNIPR